MNNLKKIGIIVFFLSLKWGISIAANAPLVSSQKWSEKVSSYNFNEDYKTFETKQTAHKTQRKPLISNFSVVKNIIILIVIIVLAVLIVILSLWIFKEFRWKVSNIDDGLKSPEIDNIEKTDLESLLELSLKNGNYKDAIRYNYLILLRILNKRRFIEWKKNKTNGHYLKEMNGKKGFDIFRVITIKFERIWYGEKEVNEKNFLELQPVFNEMNTLISRVE